MIRYVCMFLAPGVSQSYALPLHLLNSSCGAIYELYPSQQTQPGPPHRQSVSLYYVHQLRKGLQEGENVDNGSGASKDIVRARAFESHLSIFYLVLLLYDTT